MEIQNENGGLDSSTISQPDQPMTWPQPYPLIPNTNRRNPQRGLTIVKPIRRPSLYPTRHIEGVNIADIFKRKKTLDFISGAGFHGGSSLRRVFQLATWSLMAAFIDSLIVIAVACVFVMVFSFTFRTSSHGHILNWIQSGGGLLSCLQLLSFLVWVYLVSSRMVMGSTVGEWAYNLRLGRPHEWFHSDYLYKVVLRSTFIVCTGLIVLPMASLITGKDFLGKLSGLRLFSYK